MERTQALNIDVLTGAVNPMPQVKDDGDSQLYVNFESASHYNDTETRNTGRPIFEMADYIKIIVPGDASTIIHRPVRESDKVRFASQWMAYVSGKEQQVGFPLTEWPGISRAQVDELAYFKINTVESLAGVSDAVKQRFLGLTALSDKAKIWLDVRKGEEPALKLQAEVERRDEENAALRVQLADLQVAVAELQKKPRGRKGEQAVDEAA